MCAPLIAGRLAMRLIVTRAGRATYPATAQRPLADALPTRPAAVILWDATGRLPLLALDFDAKNGHGPRTVEREAREAIMLLTDAGLNPVADRGPTGGWHVYALLPQPAAAWEVRQLATALGQRWVSLDVSMLLNPDHGCIRPPGSVHKTGGHQRLVNTLDYARRALSTPPADNAWQVLRDRTGAARAEVTTPRPGRAAQAAVGVARRRISAAADQLARTGTHPRRGFDSPSEARFSVIRSAINAGWALADVEAAMRGSWAWLRESYGTKHHSALARDWRKARNQRIQTAGNRTVRIWHTSQPGTQGGQTELPIAADVDVHLLLRKFTTYCRDHQRRNHHSPRQRAVLAALIWAGHVQGRITVNVGVRAVAEQAGVSYRSVARILHELADAGLIRRLSTGRGRDADVWRLHVELGAHSRPARGRRVGMRPVFRTLGGHLAGEVYETLIEAGGPLRAGEIAATLGYPRQRVHEALLLLAGWELAAVAAHEGWSVGSADPTALARRLGGWDDWHAQHARHRRERDRWHHWLDRRDRHAGPGQLRLDELDEALGDPEQWIREYAAGSSPPDHPWAGHTAMATRMA